MDAHTGQCKRLSSQHRLQNAACATPSGTLEAGAIAAPELHGNMACSQDPASSGCPYLTLFTSLCGRLRLQAPQCATPQPVQGDLMEGNAAPDVLLLTLQGEHLHLLSQAEAGVPLVLLAGSTSCNPLPRPGACIPLPPGHCPATVVYPVGRHRCDLCVGSSMHAQLRMISIASTGQILHAACTRYAAHCMPCWLQHRTCQC